MTVTIKPIDPVNRAFFAGEVSGLDLSKPLSKEEVAAVHAGMDQYAVLVFREQPLTDEQQLAFTKHFGELEHYATAGHIRTREESRRGPGMADLPCVAVALISLAYSGLICATSPRRMVARCHVRMNTQKSAADTIKARVESESVMTCPGGRLPRPIHLRLLF